MVQFLMLLRDVKIVVDLSHSQSYKRLGFIELLESYLDEQGALFFLDLKDGHGKVAREPAREKFGEFSEPRDFGQ